MKLNTKIKIYKAKSEKISLLEIQTFLIFSQQFSIFCFNLFKGYLNHTIQFVEA